ncbi:Oligopeptide transporter OS=Castellaniella defragrans (strain DSM / CCUG 39792 / 65Phen) OX=1437824 GN=BN940_04721 PE=4 SV=1 [Castellaniella denitrificans]|uniref:OPT family oligopeptide transporter n=1 Tax=Castellaniella sp. TaxID=1955812 RepID=UPI003D13273E
MPESHASLKELTLRGVVLGALITLVFTASNVYLGLKVGLTFASSIPAAVISMAVLRAFRDSNILENNIVQTQASAAGTLSAVIFVLPALLMMGYWTGFPLMQTAMICACGGILGVVFTVPLRRALVVNSDLPYPEGVAAAEILKVGQNPGEGAETRQSGGLRDIVAGGVLAGGFSLLTGGLRLAGDSVGYWFSVGRAVFQLPLGLSFALVGAGYLVGIVGGVAMLLGVVLSWGIAVPWLTSLAPMPDGASLASFATGIWVSKVRLIGAGMIAVAAVWTLLTLIRPMIEGMRISLSVLKRGSGESGQDRTDADLPPGLLLKLTLLMILLLGATFQSFVADSGLPTMAAWSLVVAGVMLAFVFGFLVAAACGYMAGLVGSSASPISGIAVIAILASSMIFIGIGQAQDLLGRPESVRFMTALALFCTSVVVAVAAISNDNLQDLKTGWLVHATPWRQQTALIIGCVIGAVTIPPVLELLYEAYGFIGSLPRESMDPAQALAAPQASLMITIAQGLFSHTLDWTYIRIGVLVGAVLIVFDRVLGRCSRFRVPPLAVAMGVYLPPTVATALFVGALISWFVRGRVRAQALQSGADRARCEQASERTGTLFASGLIVGESLVGVVLAIVIVGSMASGGGDAPLAVAGPGFASAATVIGLLAFVLMCAVFVRRVLVAAGAAGKG